MQLVKSWWCWLKQSWRLVIIGVALYLLVDLPATWIRSVCYDLLHGFPYAVTACAVVVFFLILPWYTFLLTRLVAMLWEPQQLYDAQRLRGEGSNAQTTQRGD